MARKILNYFFIVLVCIFLDQITKDLVILKVGLNMSKDFLPGIMRFTVLKNTGGAFSILKEYPLFFQLIGLINVFIFSYLTFCPTVTFSNMIKIGCAFVLGGTFGNLIDRFSRSGVIDFIDLELFDFAVFNLADVVIDIGVALILIGWYVSLKKNDYT